MFKKILLISLLSILCAVSSVFAYSDVNDSYTYYDAITYLTENNIVQGYPDGTYKPSQTINRAEFLKIVLRSVYSESEIDSVLGQECFSDVPTNEWYSKYVCFGKNLGVVEGYPGTNEFRPASNINFVEALKVTLVVNGFSYNTSTDPWYKDVVDIGSKYNYIPYDIWKFDLELNRGQMADMITRILKDREAKFIDYLSSLGYGVNYRMTYDSIANSLGAQSIPDEEMGLPGDASNIPNLAILEYASDDPARSPQWGNVSMESVVERFYDQYPDDFDIIVTIDLGKYNEQGNGWSNGTINRYGPTNIGKIETCSTLENPTCEDYPTRLRYMQQLAYPYGTSEFTHEAAHYWGVGWHTPRADECFEPWVAQMLENGHWTELFQAGDTSTLTYPAHFLENKDGLRELTGIPYGQWVDNKDGTFTKIPTWENDEEGIFNYMDLYSMGLMTEEEFATKEMFVVLDPVPVEGETYKYYATRRDVTLDDFKQLLQERESCHLDSGDYYTGDGRRDNRGYPEIANRFRLALVLIKHPEQIITNRKARELCQLINYTFPQAWNKGSHYKSFMDVYLSEDTMNVDCSSTIAFP